MLEPKKAKKAAKPQKATKARKTVAPQTEKPASEENAAASKEAPLKNKKVSSSSPKDAPKLVFGIQDKPISEIQLAPGEQQTIQVILSSHPEAITMGIQAQWTMYDSNRQPTESITCKKRPRYNDWLLPLNLSTNDENKGGMEGNVISSNNFEHGIWRSICTNTTSNQFWYPRGQFTPPIAVAEFTIKAPSDWKDEYATFELDTDYTLFIQTPNTSSPSSSRYEAKCNYDMVLTIKNKNLLSKPAPEIKDPEVVGNKVLIKAEGEGQIMLTIDKTKKLGENQVTIEKKYDSQKGLDLEAYACIWGNGIAISKTSKRIIHINPKDPPELVFGDVSGNQLKEFQLSPGEEKKIQIILNKHDETITNSFKLKWTMYDSSHNPTSDISIKKTGKNGWFSPLNLSSTSTAAGGFKKNELKQENPSTGVWVLTGINSNQEQFWYPTGKFTPPIAVAEFTIQASKNWTDKSATFELDTDSSEFAQTSDTAVKTKNVYITKPKSAMALTIVKHDAQSNDPAKSEDGNGGAVTAPGGEGGGGGGSIIPNGSDEGNNKLESLSFRSIIGGPLKACVEAQQETANATYNYMTSTVLERDSDGVADFKPVMMRFCFIKDGLLHRLEIPLMTIIPIPYMSIDYVDLNFEAMVTYCKQDTSDGTFTLKACYSDHAGAQKGTTEEPSNGIIEKSKDTITARENISIRIHATTSDQPAGMSRLMEILDNHFTEFTQIEEENG